MRKEVWVGDKSNEWNIKRDRKKNEENWKRKGRVRRTEKERRREIKKHVYKDSYRKKTELKRVRLKIQKKEREQWKERVAEDSENRKEGKEKLPK